MPFTTEVFDSEGTLAIMKDGTDVLHVSRVNRETELPEWDALLAAITKAVEGVAGS